jgi:enoyl-CoA hydratase/carnithine racemase
MLAPTRYQYLLLEVEDGIATLTLNRSEKRNALSLEVMHELTGAFESLGADRGVRVVVLRGVGPAFSAGHDLREMLARSVEDYRHLFDVCVRLMQTIQTIPQPVIAEIAGIATAAGCQLVATCDLAVASSEARFATPGVQIGLFCTTPMVALTRAIGRKRAMQMLLTGEPIDARTAADWGLVNAVVPPDELAGATRALAQRIAGSAKFVIELGKAAFYAQIDLDQPKAYAYAKEVMSMNALADDAQEGMGAFVGKRAPVWRT